MDSSSACSVNSTWRAGSISSSARCCPRPFPFPPPVFLIGRGFRGARRPIGEVETVAHTTHTTHTHTLSLFFLSFSVGERGAAIAGRGRSTESHIGEVKNGFIDVMIVWCSMKSTEPATRNQSTHPHREHGVQLYGAADRPGYQLLRPARRTDACACGRHSSCVSPIGAHLPSGPTSRARQQPRRGRLQPDHHRLSHSHSSPVALSLRSYARRVALVLRSSRLSPVLCRHHNFDCNRRERAPCIECSPDGRSAGGQRALPCL
jgi:hypothetical protein